MQIDQLLIICYFLLTISIGFYKKSSPDLNSFLFAGRKLTIPALVASLVSTWYGGILEVGRFTYANGISTWIIFGLFYYIAAIIFATYIAPKIIKLNIPTIPQLFYNSYGKKASIIAIVCILFIASPAPYLKIFATLFSHVWNIPTFYALLIGIVFTLSYTLTGGFSSVIRTDKFQFILMFIGFSMILTSCYTNYGGIQFIRENTPSYALSIPGNFNWSFIFIWGFIALVTLIDPSFYQRSFAGQSISIVKKSIYISVMCWFIFDFMTITTGLYALAILPQNTINNPYLALSDMVLPPLSQGIFMVSLFAIVMSTIDSFSFISAYTVGRDLPQVLRKKNNDDSIQVSVNIGLLFTGIVAIIISLLFSNAIDIWYSIGSLVVPALLIPLLYALSSVKIKFPTLCMIVPFIFSATWHLHGVQYAINGYPQYLYQLDPMYPGLILSALMCYLLRVKGVIK